MQELLALLAPKFPSEWVVASYDGWSLELSSGMSVEYAVPAIVFSGVSYLSCPFEFSWPVFRESTPQEREQLQAVVPLGAQDVVVALEAETMAGPQRQSFFIVAQQAVLATPRV